MNAQLAPRPAFEVEALRIPPHAIDAEQAVLGMLMLVPESLAKVSDWLAEDDFYRKDHRLIYRAIVGLIGRGDPVDPVTLADWFAAGGIEDLAGGLRYLVELADSTASAANIVAHAEIIVEKSRLRAAIATGTQLVEAAWERGADSRLVIANASHDLAKVQTQTMRGALEPAKGALQRMYASAMERMRRGPGLIGEPWPWIDLNRCTNGLRDGTLYIVGARPSMGKSVMGLQVAVFTALRGQRTAFFSVEMGAEECMGRAVACVGNIPHAWVEHPDQNVENEDYWPRYSETIGLIDQSGLLIDETPVLSVRQMLARARRAHMQKPLRLIVVDHMHDMEIDPKNARFDYGVITQAGKTMAKEFRCPVILLAQLNRSAANRSDKRPTMTDLRESGEIEQKADVILFLHREDYYEPSKAPGVVEVIPAKGRNIKTGETIYLGNQFDRMRLIDWEGDLPEWNEPSKPRGYGMKAPL
jgi:replicative DNA helicase